LGTIKVADLDQDQLDAFYAQLQAKGLSAMSIRHVHALLNASLRFGLKRRLTRHNPATLATPPPARAKAIKSPTVAEVRGLIATAEDRDPTLATLLLVAALTGARRGELCGVQWADIDWREHSLAIQRSVFSRSDGSFGLKPPKTHQLRRVTLDPVALEALRRHRKRVDGLAKSLDLKVTQDGFVFSDSPQGLEPLRPELVTGRTRRIARAAKVPITPHTLRHFQATQGIANGFDAVTVAQRLGHADPSITLKIYSHAVEQRDRDLAKAMGQVLTLGAAGDEQGFNREGGRL
jgi:integrase